MGGVLKKVVSVAAKVADVVAPIASFIPGLNPVVTAIAAGVKIADGLTDKPPNLGKALEGAMSFIPGGALGKMLGPLSKLGGGTAGKAAEMFAGALTGGGGGQGGVLGDLLGKVMPKIGGADSVLGSLAGKMFSELSGKFAGSAFKDALTKIISDATNSKDGEKLSLNQIADAFAPKTGRSVDRSINGEVQSVPEAQINPELVKLLQSIADQIRFSLEQNQSSFQSNS